MDEPVAPDRSKLWVTLLVILSADALLWIGKIDAAAWVSTNTWVAAAFILGQVGAVVATGWSTKIAAQAAEMLRK